MKATLRNSQSKSEGSSTLAQDFASWFQTNATDAKRFTSPDIDEYIASLYIREIYPELTVEDTVTLMDNQRFMNKIASGTFPKHVQVRLLVARTSVQFKDLYENTYHSIVVLRKKILKKYPVILERLALKRRRGGYASSWTTNTPKEAHSSRTYFPGFSMVFDHAAVSPPSYSAQTSPCDNSNYRNQIQPVDSIILLNNRHKDQESPDSQASVSVSEEFYSPLASPGDAYYTGKELRVPQSPDEKIMALFEAPETLRASTLYTAQKRSG